MFHDAFQGDSLEFAKARQVDTDWTPTRRRLFWVGATLFCVATWGGVAWLGHAAWTSLF